MSFHYVYILQSAADPKHFYVGLTKDLQERLRKHNAGEVPHTSKFKPWTIKTAIAFRDRDRPANLSVTSNQVRAVRSRENIFRDIQFTGGLRSDLFGTIRQAF